MQQLDNSLDNIGYTYSRKLLDPGVVLSTEAPSESLCHYYDVLIKDPKQESEKSRFFEAFYKVISTPNYSQVNAYPSSSPKREFVKDDERRRYLLDEFIKTEANYLSTLKAFVSLIVEPLRQRTKDRNTAIIGQYECAKIFMNIDDLIHVTNGFYTDLVQYRQHPEGKSLGDLCLKHMRRCDCYNNFLLGVHNARIINEKQLKNGPYLNFLERAKNSKGSGSETVYDYLALPGQRVGRYTMYFKELIKHTTDDHIDLPGLRQALLKAEKIANMTEEIHTQIMKIFRRLLQSIQHCPESLISFQRRFVSYIDATEIDVQTSKPIQSVTLFLFSDKVMLVRRPASDVDGLDLCGLDQRMDSHGSDHRTEFFIPKDANTGKLKFIGWANLTDLDVFTGADKINSFTLLCHHSGQIPFSPDTDETTQRSLEAYFQRDEAHTFIVNSVGNSMNRQYLQTPERTLSHFVHQFGKAKNNLGQSEQLIQTTHCEWRGHHFFANIYPTSKYDSVANKSEVALFYIEHKDVDVETILGDCFIAPTMVGFVVPHDRGDHYRFAMQSKCAIGNTANGEISLLKFGASSPLHIQNAQNQLFGNLLASDRDLLKSSRLAAHPSTQEEEKGGGRFFIKNELIRKKSKTTFKLFTSLGNNKILSHISGNDSRPRTASANNSHPIQNALANGSTSKSFSTSSGSSLKSQHSGESRMTLQSLASSHEESTPNLISPGQSLLRKHASFEQPSTLFSNEQRYFSPSFHPSRTASYEIKSASQGSLRLNDERVLYLGSGDLLGTPQSHSRNSTPGMTDSNSAISTINSRFSTLSTFNSQRSTPNSMQFENTSPYHHRPLSDSFIPIVHPSHQDRPSSPSSSKNYTYPSSSFHSDSDSRTQNLYNQIRDKDEAIFILTSLLHKKDSEIEMLKADLSDSVTELGTVCDKFNSELDELANIYESTFQNYQPSGDDELERPPHPAPEIQIRRKLETTLKEKTHWQYRALELEHQLRMLTNPYNGTQYPNRRFSQNMPKSN